jgi:hypothetical protein
VSTSGSYNVYPKDIKPAYVQEWNLTTEYAVTSSMSLQVGYLGEQGQHVEDYGNVNQWRVNGDATSAPYYNNQYIGQNAPIGSIGSSPLLITESRAAIPGAAGGAPRAAGTRAGVHHELHLRQIADQQPGQLRAERERLLGRLPELL